MAGDFASHEALYGYADFDHTNSVLFPDSAIYLRIECGADTFENSIRWPEMFISTK